MKISTPSRLALILAAAALALSACASPSVVSPVAAEADSFAISDAWVKAADDGMSAAFGELTNTGATDLTITSVSTAASTSVELHETVMNDAGDMVMRQKDKGFIIPAGGSLALKPGGNHIMLMDVIPSLKAGEEVTFTITFSDESTVEFTAPVKDYSGANETYDGGTDMGN